MPCPICRKPSASIYLLCPLHEAGWHRSPEGERAKCPPAAVVDIEAYNNSMLADFVTRARAEGL